jgi:hypothetical protein
MKANGARLGAGRMVIGLAAGTAAGLASYVFLEVGGTLLQTVLATSVLGLEWEAIEVGDMVTTYLVYGLPLALVLGLAIGLPVWKRTESRGLRSRRDAMTTGATVGAIIGLLLLLTSFLGGLQTYLDDSFTFDSWRYGYQVTRDGLPTPLGWLLNLLQLLYFAAAGAIGGLTARAVALPRTMKG